jgi:hypothetical protein
VNADGISRRAKASDGCAGVLPMTSDVNYIGGVGHRGRPRSAARGAIALLSWTR